MCVKYVKHYIFIKSRIDKILFPVLKDMREELKIEHEEKIKRERDEAKEKEMKKFVNKETDLDGTVI